MRFARRRLLAALLAVVPTGATAQVTDLAPGCQTSPLRVLGYDPAPAQESFATLARHTFAEDGTGPDRLGVSVVLPPELAQDCPGGTIEPMRGIRALGDGRYEGWVVPISMSSHGHLFGETFTFTADQVWDWTLPALEDGGRLFGAYRLRWTYTHRSVDGGSIMIRLMPSPLPADWN